jgi:o-succinylbenzoate synthase
VCPAFVPEGLGIGYEVDMEEVLKHTTEKISFKYNA